MQVKLEIGTLLTGGIGCMRRISNFDPTFLDFFKELQPEIDEASQGAGSAKRVKSRLENEQNNYMTR